MSKLHPDMTFSDLVYQPHLKSNEVGDILLNFADKINETNIKTLTLGEYEFHVIYCDPLYVPNLTKCKVNNTIYFLTSTALYVRSFGQSELVTYYRFRRLLETFVGITPVGIHKMCNEIRPI